MRVLITLMPTVSAACGCSPHARIRRPHREWNSMNCSTPTTTYIVYTKMVCWNSTGPIRGILDRIGIEMTGSDTPELKASRDSADTFSTVE